MQRNQKKQRPLVYLASPYSHPDPQVQEERYLAAKKACLWGWQQGYWVFSPIVYTHPLARLLPPIAHEEWLAGDLKILAACDECWVLLLDGWKTSAGITQELQHTTRCEKPLRLLQPHHLEEPLHEEHAA